MTKYKVLDFGYENFGEENWVAENIGYTQEATLVVTAENEETNAKYDFYFEDVTIFTSVRNFLHSNASAHEPAWDEWTEEYIEMDEDCYPVVTDVRAISGPELDDEEPTEEEQDYILSQIGSGYIEL